MNKYDRIEFGEVRIGEKALNNLKHCCETNIDIRNIPRNLKEYLNQNWQLKRRVPEYQCLTVPFDGYEKIDFHNGQAGQDLFVLSCLDGKTNGLFVELGCETPSLLSNTLLLETMFGWNGVSVDINPIKKYPDHMDWSQRRTNLLIEDGTKIDFDKVATLLGSTHFDYLQLDLDPAHITLNGLRNIPFDRVEFSVITYEHDYYANRKQSIQNTSRKILKDNGYELLCQDVHWHGKNFEDWYYNPRHIDRQRVEPLKSVGKEWTSIMFNSHFFGDITI